MPHSPVVTCVGAITLDVIALVSSFPEPDGRTEAEDVMITGGGPAANAAVALSRQGIPTALVGRVGEDQAGRQALELLEGHGVETSGVVVDPEISTQTSCIVVDRGSGTRSIVTSHTPPLTGLGERARELALGSAWIHADHVGYAAAAGLAGGGGGPRLSLDSGNAPIEDLDLSRVDLYVPTAESLRRAMGLPEDEQAAAAALRAGCHAVVATDGASGSQAWWDDAGAAYASAEGEGAGHAAAPALTEGVEIVSTLGAGDVFHGALLAALVRGAGYPEALRRANITAALACEGRDGRETVPDAATVDRRYAAMRP